MGWNLTNRNFFRKKKKLTLDELHFNMQERRIHGLPSFGEDDEIGMTFVWQK